MQLSGARHRPQGIARSRPVAWPPLLWCTFGVCGVALPLVCVVLVVFSCAIFYAPDYLSLVPPSRLRLSREAKG